ncbi:UNVERIFIED_CONTAM: SAG-related sequence SRS47D [Hammondia hammondi]|eukprot:XP_008886619.1 SAG-related sequence SRS47D [Hammondia hammondi]
MSVKRDRCFQGLRGLQCAARLAITVGLVCLSACGAEVDVQIPTEETPVSCGDTEPRFVPLSLSKNNLSRLIKCPVGLSLFPKVKGDGSAAQYCEDSTCTKNLASIEGLTLEEKRDPQKEEAAETAELHQTEGGNEKVYTLRLSQQPSQSETLYFQCRSIEVSQPESTFKTGTETPSAQPTATCTFQVAVHGSQPFSDESEKECTLGQTLAEVTLKSGSNKVTFRCGTGGVLSPANFEKTLDGENCASETSLAGLDLGAKLVEGNSSRTEATVPAYALEVSKFPTDSKHVRLCYKCEKPSATQKSPSVPSNTEACKITVNVVPNPKTEPEQQEEEGTEDVEPGDQENQKPSTSDARDHPTHSFGIAGALLLSSVLALNQTV